MSFAELGHSREITKSGPVGLVLLLLVLAAPIARAQETNNVRPSLLITQPATKLVDQFGNLQSEDRSARFDSLFQEIKQNPGSIGYVFLYCGKKCRYGEIEAHQRGIEIKIALRGFDRSRIVVVNAGFRENFETELWISRDSEIAPTPKSTVNIRFVEFARSTKREIEWYDCCDDFTYVWKNLKP